MNLPGGKILPGEDGLAAAYRELREETGLAGDVISLTHLMDFTYHLYGIRLEVYFGRLRRETPVFGEENELFWESADQNFFDFTQFAGEGNLGHVMAQIRLSGGLYRG